MNKRVFMLSLICVIALVGIGFKPTLTQASQLEQGSDSNPPDTVVKLVFIHHSTGENWLSDGYGNLGHALVDNNYFVSDTNYGWGPNGIGDRTDIPDWEEWFRSGDTATYMEALFNEGEQYADYSRSSSDPGGENEIILFKSCFPNSDLEGSPNDPPSAEGWLSVGHAKYVYNEILTYFGQHPEKLFVVITAPPLSDRDNAANARAFNQWLVYDWLRDNDYPHNNVAVFDFYNVLTGKDGHHTVEDGEVIHQIANRDTLHYPSGDDHPSKKGSQKATEEFIPLLNYFYNHWQQDAPFPVPAHAEVDSESDSGQSDSDQPDAAPPDISGLIDNFEGGMPAGTNGWEAYWDEGTTSSLICGADSGIGLNGSSLRLDYQISSYSWGTCGLYYEQVQDWSATQGLVFSILVGQSDQVLHVDLFADGPEGQESYIFELDLTLAMEDDWIPIGIPWESFHRVDWEADAGSPFSKPDLVTGIAFGFGSEESQLEGELWIDELGWMADGEVTVEESADQEVSQSEELEEEEPGGRSLPCIGSLAMPLGLVGIALFQRKKLEER